MSRAVNVIRFYVLCNKLKDVVRTGWKVWNVKRERLESIAEHVYGVQMLAIAMWSEYQYAIDLEKVILMLALHELEEIEIGDYNPFEITKEEKSKIGHAAVVKILEGMLNGDEILRLVVELDEGKTPEAKFAYLCDKLEAGLQCRIYDEAKCINMNEQEGNAMLMDEAVKKIAEKGGGAAEIWLEYDQEKNKYDKNFAEVADYVCDHKISEFIS